jgi:predicted thioesterase
MHGEPAEWDGLLGRTAEIEIVVGPSDTATSVGSGDVEVLATPRVLALCEQATVAAVAAALPEETTSVGVRVELDHLRANLPGDRVLATAEVVAVDRRRLVFDVQASDEAGVVARGRVVRAVVDRKRFMERAGGSGQAPAG